MPARVLPALAVLIGLVVLGLAAVTARIAGMPVGRIARDPQSTQDTSAALGAINGLNNMGWAVAGALSLFVGWAPQTYARVHAAVRNADARLRCRRRAHAARDHRPLRARHTELAFFASTLAWVRGSCGSWQPASEA